MRPPARQLVTTATVLCGVVSSAWLLSAFRGDVEGIFTSRDRRFALLLLVVAATLSALSSKAIGFVIGIVALVIMLSQSYPAGQLDLGALRWASALLVLFDIGLGLQIWLERDEH